MTPMLVTERRLVAAVSSFAPQDGAAEKEDEVLSVWLTRLESCLEAHPLKTASGLREFHPVGRETQRAAETISTSRSAWERRWRDLEPSRRLAKSFENQVMLLVFGKLNAGKSSLCNFLADRFRAHGQSV